MKYITFIFLTALWIEGYIGCKKNSYKSIQNKHLLVSATLPDIFQTAIIRNDSILFTAPYGTAVTNIKFHFNISENAQASITQDSYIDLSKPLDFIIQQGNYKEKYVILLSTPVYPDTAIRAVWVTNVGSPALSSTDNIQLMVDYISQLNFNTIYVDVWNKNQTLQPSAVLEKEVPPGTQTQMFGSGWDPLMFLLQAAHQKGIRVIAWFEYGFISHYSGYPHPILDQHPDWIGIDKNGMPTIRNNFTWLNGFKPEVQDFLLQLILEVVRKYPIDGIQCDDHLPSMPLNSGYDSLTLSRYETETGNNIPVSDTDPKWMKWRADQLTLFAKKIYDSVKFINPRCIVCFAPGPLDWSYENNLADWESWIKLGIVDLLSPLLYRSESAGLSAYTNLLDKDISRIIRQYSFPKQRYAPGIMVKNGNYAPSDSYLSRVFLYNFFNEIYSGSIWYYDGLPNNEKVYRAFYPAKAIFPVY